MLVVRNYGSWWCPAGESSLLLSLTVSMCSALGAHPSVMGGESGGGERSWWWEPAQSMWGAGLGGWLLS